MLDRIRSLFESINRGEAGDRQDDLHMAAAALLVEAARTDDTISAEERARIVDLVRRRFDLGEADATALFDDATARTGGASHLYDYVSTIVDHCPPERRVWIIEMLWEVAYADGVLNDLEASLLRRIGGMLAVTDVERGAARKRVLKRLGLPDDAGLGV